MIQDDFGGFGQFGGGGFGGGGQNVNFNHPDYHMLRNFYIGIVNEKKKDNQGSYARVGF